MYLCIAFVSYLAQTVFPGANQQKRFLLIASDLFTLYIWAVPLASKSGKNVLDGLKSLFAEAFPRRPSEIHTDKGTCHVINSRDDDWFITKLTNHCCL